MAYRRRHGLTRASTFKEEIYQPTSDNHYNNRVQNDGSEEGNDNDNGSLPTSPSPPPSSSMYMSHKHPNSFRSLSFPKGSFHPESSFGKDANDSNYGFWGTLARKAKSILEEDGVESPNKMKPHGNDTTIGGHDNDKLRKGLDVVTSSISHLGDTLGKAFEEGRTITEHTTADIIQETRNKTSDVLQETSKLQIRRRGGNFDTEDLAIVLQNSSWERPVIRPVHTHPLANQKTQLKASRDVAMATAAKAKVLLRELKTVKADLAFAKERCAQLEEENKRLRDSRGKGSNHADDDLVRLQLETLLAEKARLAHENSIYARENGFLREIVEYHQLTMQEIVYLDEGAEELTEICPFNSIEDTKLLGGSGTPTSLLSPYFPSEFSAFRFAPEQQDVTEVPKEASNTTTSSSTSSPPGSPPGRKGYSEILVSSQNMQNEKR